MPKVQDVTGEYAVLVPLVERPEGLCLLYEVRADTLGRQPGEVCFPGGRLEPGGGRSLLRPAGDVGGAGHPPAGGGGGGRAGLAHPPGGFVLYPVLGIVAPEAAERLRPGPAEVKETFFVPVDWLRAHPPEVYAYPLEPRVGEDFPYARIGFPQGYRWRGGRVEVPIYAWEGRAIWGLTGRITPPLLEGMP